MGDWMNTYLVIKEEKVVNIVVWDGVSDWMPPEGTTVLIAPAGVGIGWTKSGSNWIEPEPAPAPEEDPNKVSARAKLAALGLTESEISALLGA